ncbi:MAG TPA: pyruvate, water dikinase regulatory protein [Burkholderiales bacterium]|jgi:regulator of PEP synthase PpsR (kinase-PPPase family)|nr:pyruvate, water dikinase regulatory protein [Burkholderiales bacterium]
MPEKRTAFFVSDRTGITAEMLGHSLLTQFDDVSFTQITLPFVDAPDKAAEAVRQINRAAQKDGRRPLVFSTLVDPALSSIVQEANALYLDCFQVFIAPMEKELGVKSSHTVGRSHSVKSNEYYERIEAVNFALAHDDGQSTKELHKADVILIGVSRSGKTPTCLYLALQFGIRAANYPLIPEDFAAMKLPEAVGRYRGKLFGLTIQPERLQRIRAERRPGSTYATLDNCQFEVRAAETLMRQENIPILDTTTRSIEELSTVIMQQANLQRHVY